MTGLKIGELASGLTASPYIVDYVLDGICKAKLLCVSISLQTSLSG